MFIGYMSIPGSSAENNKYNTFEHPLECVSYYEEAHF
jgi:hypothetical protein